MDPGKQSHKEELTRRLAGTRSMLHLPDPRQLMTQGRQLVQVASKLPATMQGRPVRTAIIVGGVACVVALLVKPRRKKRKRAQAEVALALQNNSSIPKQLFAYSLTLAQPLIRVWLTEQTRRWMKGRRN